MCVLAHLLSLHSVCACMNNILHNHLMAFLSHMWKDVAVCQRLRESKSGRRAKQGCVYSGWAYMCHSCHAWSNYRHWSTSKGFVLPVFYNKAPLPPLHCVTDTHTWNTIRMTDTGSEIAILSFSLSHTNTHIHAYTYPHLLHSLHVSGKRLKCLWCVWIQTECGEELRETEWEMEARKGEGLHNQREEEIDKRRGNRLGGETSRIHSNQSNWTGLFMSKRGGNGWGEMDAWWKEDGRRAGCKQVGEWKEGGSDRVRGWDAQGSEMQTHKW